MFIRTVIAAIVIGSSLCVGTARANAPAPQPSAVPTLDRADLEAWLDGFLPTSLKRSSMAGAVISVVKDGQVLLEKGYGYADLAEKRPMDPTRTGVGIASISKLFTATAVMQLVEQGKLDLDADVNRYLDFTIPSPFGKTITLRDLLTHTAGFEDVQKGSSPSDITWLKPLDAYLKTRIPTGIYPPGTIPAYSNYGSGLASLIVQRVSGEPFETYVDRHILQPLGMERTSCRQPIPDALLGNMSKIYKTTASSPKPIGFTLWRGAGCIVSTASDMTRFMLAHLQNGGLGDTRILRPETAAAMHARAFSPVSRINGMALGFFQEDRNGHRIIGHDGDYGFHSDMHLFLDDGVGLFVAFNGDGTDGAIYGLREGLFRSFADRYFPGPVPDEKTVDTAREHAHMTAGLYESSRRLTGILSMFMLFNSVEVSAGEDGTIAIALPPEGHVKRFHEIAPHLWREVGGKSLLEMTVENGAVSAFYDHPVGAFLRVPFWRSSALNLPLFGFSAVTFLITVLSWPVVALLRRRYARQPAWAGWERRAYLGARIGAFLNLAFIAGWLFVAVSLLAHFDHFNESLDPWFRALQCIGLIGVLGTAAAIASSCYAWRRSRGWGVRIWSIILAAAGLALLWFALLFDLFSLSLRY